MIMGLYDRDFVDTEEYAQLLVKYHPDASPSSFYGEVCEELRYEFSISKASMISWPAYRYIHLFLRRTSTKHVDSTGVLGRLNLL